MSGISVFDNNSFWIKIYKEGNYIIEVTNDNMAVLLSITPSIGGAKIVKSDEIIAELKKLQIKANIDKQKIESNIDNVEKEHQALNKIKIVQGKAPEHGKDAYLEYIVKISTGKNFKEDATGRIDFRERDLITAISKDQIIAVLYKPQSGVKHGVDVFGHTLLAEPGNDLKITMGKNVYKKEYNDKIEFYSEIDGHLKNNNNELTVLPIYIINTNVDFSTGNVKFNGNVIIEGDVLDNFSVEAEGDIQIKGNVGQSLIKGNGDITINNGFLGKNTGKIICYGNLDVRFIENGIVECDQSSCCPKGNY